MKKILTISLLLFTGVFLLAGCVKRDYYDHDRNDDDGDYWYAQERGTVILSSDVCPYFILDLGDTYAIMRSLTSADDYPYPDDYIYGNFNDVGTRDYFNDAQSDHFYDGYIMRATLVEFEPDYDKAKRKVDNQYCGGIVAKAAQNRIRINSVRIK